MFELSGDFKLEILARRLKIQVEAQSESYKRLLTDPEFSYSSFTNIGGWPLLEFYKSTIELLEFADENLDLTEHKQQAQKIINTYNKRWGIN